MREILRLLFQRQAPWWHFWNPKSGFVGGVLSVLLTILAAALCSRLLK